MSFAFLPHVAVKFHTDALSLLKAADVINRSRPDVQKSSVRGLTDVEREGHSEALRGPGCLWG